MLRATCLALLIVAQPLMAQAGDPVPFPFVCEYVLVAIAVLNTLKVEPIS